MLGEVTQPQDLDMQHLWSRGQLLNLVHDLLLKVERLSQRPDVVIRSTESVWHT